MNNVSCSITCAFICFGIRYSIPAWKLPVMPQGIMQEVERLNSVTSASPIFMVHDVSGHIDNLKTLALQLSRPCFGLRLTPTAMRTCPTIEVRPREPACMSWLMYIHGVLHMLVSTMNGFLNYDQSILMWHHVSSISNRWNIYWSFI